MKIRIAVDDEKTRDVIVAQLRQLGHEVEIVQDLELLESNHRRSEPESLLLTAREGHSPGSDFREASERRVLSGKPVWTEATVNGETTLRLAKKEPILIAEDDTTSRLLLTALLQKNGHDVVATNDGERAWLEAQRRDAPRIVVADWMMPKINGIELCQKLKSRELGLSPYFILLTALSEKKHITEGLDAGADDYIVKPFDPLELRARIAAGERVLAMRDGLVRQAEELREAAARIKSLSGLIPICMHCRRVRDDKSYWSEVEEYVQTHTDAFFSHGLCPDCFESRYGDDSDP